MAGRRSFSVSGRIEAEDKASKTVAKVQGRFAKFGNWLKSSFVITAGDVYRAFQKITDAMLSGVKAALDLQRAHTGLAAAMRSAGTYSKEALASFKEQEIALEKTTNTARQTTARLQGLALAFTASNEGAAELTEAALDFATGAGLNYEEALRRMGRAMQGTVDDLSKFVPGVKELTKAQLAAGKATELVAARFRGEAAAATESLAGALDALTLAFGRANEMMSQGVTESTELEASVRSLAAEIDAGEEQWRALGTAGDWVARKTAGFSKEMVTLVRAYIEVFRNQGMVIEGLKDEAEAASDAARAVDQLTEAEKRRRDIEAGIVKQTEDMATIFKELGVTLETDVQRALEKNEATMRQVEAGYRQGLVSVRDLANAKTVLALSSLELTAELYGEKVELQGVTEATNGMTEATDRAAVSHQRLIGTATMARQEMQRTRQELITSTADWDRLAGSMSRATMAQQVVAAGGYVSGNRVFWPGGGGSRFVTEPGFSGVDYEFGQTGGYF